MDWTDGFQYWLSGLNIWQLVGVLGGALLGTAGVGGLVLWGLRQAGALAMRTAGKPLAAWWRKPGRLARIEARLDGLAAPAPAARPPDYCCAACGLHRHPRGDACRCGCYAVVPTAAYGSAGNTVAPSAWKGGPSC